MAVAYQSPTCLEKQQSESNPKSGDSNIVKPVTRKLQTLALCVGLVAGLSARADEAPPATAPAASQEDLVQTIKKLEQRVAELEGKSTQVVTTASIPSATMDFLSKV